MFTGTRGIELIKHFESLHDGDLTRIGLQPKLCPSGIWTVGWGHAVVDPKTGKFVTKDTPMGYLLACSLFKDLTIEQANKLLLEDIKKVEITVNKKLKVDLFQNEFDALISHAYNCGVSPDLYKLVNNRKDCRVWWENHYITGDRVRLPGLVRRRLSEYNLFKTGQLNFFE